MAYNVKITYAGPAVPEAERAVSPISGTYAPTNSYTETVAYDGTVYDTNVRGWGSIDIPEPYASTSFPFPVPMAQFNVAVIGEDVMGDDGEPTGEKFIEFEVETYEQAFYYMETGKALAGQGFTVEVTKA